MNNIYNSLCSGTSTSHKNSWQKKAALLLFFVMFGVLGVQGQVSVSTTGSATTTLTTGTNAYASLAAAVTALNGATNGGTGTVVLTLEANETAPAGGYSITAQGTSSVGIIIDGNSKTVTAGVGTSTTTDAFFKLVGADYITVKNFTMLESGSNTTATQQIEWGVALLHASVTNGAQNNTIQNNTITLNKTNLNSFGIYSNNRHSATAVGTTEDITNNTTGPNSGNKVYTNAISNVNMGIAFIGCSTAANQDSGNDIGGSSSGTGNTISNWGGAAASSSYISNSGTSYCIFVNHQVGDNVSYNTITSASLSGTAVTVVGIRKDYSTTAPTGTFTSSITNNTITITSGFTSGTLQCILSQGMTALSTATININNNTILNSAVSGASSSTTIVGILNSSIPGTLNINSNIFRGNTSTATSGGFTAISNTGAVVTAVNINSNQIGNATGGVVTFSAATSGTFTGISNTGAAATCSVSIQSNDIRGITYSAASSATQAYITSTGTPLNNNVSSNTFTNLNVNTTASATFINHGYSMTATGTQTFSNNSIVTAFNKGGAGGSVIVTTSNSTSTSGSTSTYTNNNFSNITVTGATTLTGFNNTDGGTGSAKTVTGNTFNSWTGGTNTVTPINITYFSGTSTVSTNTVTNITGQGAITGINLGSTASGTSLTIASNTINNLTSTGTGGAVTGLSCSNASTTINLNSNAINTLSSTGAAAVTALSIGGGATTNVFQNKIYDISGSNAGTTVNGILISAGTTINTYNNLIGDLRASIASGIDVIRGISITSSTATSTQRVYDNTIYLNATSSGANFGSSGIFHTYSATATTAALDMRNNIIDNASGANGTGKAVAFRRSAATDLNNYATTSNNNLFFGTTAVYYDGTNTDGSTAFQTRVSTRETASKFQNPTFASTTGSSSTFLHFANLAINLAGGNGQVIGSPYLTDFDGDTKDTSIPDIGADEWNNGTVSPPTITSFTPTTLCVQGGQTVTITGTNLDTVSSVLFNGASGVTLAGTITGTATSTSLTVIAPADVVDGIIRVTNPAASADSPSTFTSAGTPTVGVSSNVAICSGSSTSLTATGGATYSWSPATGLSATTGDTVTANPTTTTTYTVTGASAAGCTATATVTVTVNAVPTAISLAKNPTSSCAGGVTTITVTGGTIGGAGTATLGAGASTTSGSGGSGTNYVSPFTHWFGAYKAQYVIRASELTALGLSAGPVNSLAFDVTTAGTTYTAFTMSVGTTTATTASSTFDTSSVTQVYTGNLNVSSTGLNTLAFGTGSGSASSFTWDGTSNVLINLCWSNSNGGGTAAEVKYDATSFVAMAYYRVDTSGPSVVCAITSATGTQSNRPKMVFGYNNSVATTVLWSPTTDLYTNAGATTGYTNENIRTAYSKGTASNTYTVTSTSNGCSSSNTVTVAPNALPTISTNGITICDGGSGSTITATGGTSYSWTPSTGLSAANVANPTANPTATTTYTVTGTDANGCQNTATSTVTVNNHVVITSQPINQVVLEGNPASFTVAATGTGVTYQWQENGVDMSGETAATLTIAATTAAQDGYGYRCVVSGTSPCASVTSSTATLTVGNVSITTQPTPQTICSDSSATFTIGTTGTVTSYQWQYSTNGGTSWTNVASGGTSDTLVVSGLSSANTGNLYHVVLNGSVTSNSASVTVYDAIVFGTQPTNQSVCASSAATFTAAAGGSGLAYQWQFSTNGGTSWANVASAGTSGSYIVSSATAAMNGYQYRVIASGTSPCSAVTSSVATLTVTDVTVAASSASFCIGGSTTLNATFVGSPDYTTSSWVSATTGSGAESAVSGNSATVTPTVAGTFIYTFSSNGTCPFTKTVSVTVNPLPTITTATATPAAVCSGGTINLAATSVQNANGTAAVGAGALTASTTSNGISPFSYNWGGTKTQYLIKASELTALGFVAGNLTSLAVETTSVGQTYTGFSLSIGSTSATALTSTFLANGTQVYLGTLTNDGYLPVANSLNTFNFGTGSGSASSFAWDGTSNVVVTFSWSSIPTASNAVATPVKYDTTSFVSATYKQSDSVTPAVMLASTTGTALSTRPKFTFGGVKATDLASSYTWSWSPGSVSAATGTTSVTNTSGSDVTQTFTATATSAAGCVNSATTSAVTVHSTIAAPTGTDSTQCGTGTPTASVTGVGSNFRWYLVSTNGTALAGQTASTLSGYPISSTTTFYVSEASADGLCESPRTAVVATVTSPFAFTLSASTASNCSGSASLTPVTIATNGGYTSYSWSNSATVTGNETTGWYFAPTTTTTYTVTATGGGCSTTASVVVTPVALPIVTASASPASICNGGTSTLTALTSTIGAGIVTIGTGTSLTSATAQPTAFCNRWPSYRMQTVYTAAELQAAGLTAGNITSMAFNITTLGDGATNAGFEVKIANTASSTLSGDFVSTATGFTTVYPSQTYTHTATGWQTIPFSTPFSWNGTSNIIVEVIHSGADSLNNSITEYTATAGNTVAYTTTASTNAASFSTTRLNVRFGGQAAVSTVGSLAYSWNDPSSTTGNVLTITPGSTVTYTASGYNSTTGCTGTASATVTVFPIPTAPTATNGARCGTGVVTTATVADTNSFTTPTFKWYADNVTTTALQSSTSASYTTSISATTTFYVSVVSPGGCESTRTAITLTVNTPATVTILPAAPTVCTGGNVTLTASGASTYTWSPALGLNGTTTASVVSTPGATTTYSVTGIDANGCTTAAATVTVTVAGYPSAVTIAQGAASVCTNSVMSLTASGGTIINTGATASQYVMTPSSTSYADITGTTLGATSIGDDVGIGNLPIGFSFPYNGSSQTVFGASSNGLLLLGNTTASITGLSGNALASTANVISPFWDDNNTTGGSIIYATTGTAPNRVLTVQWTNMHVGGSGSSSNPTISVQALLYESGKIEFIYGSQSAALSAPGATIGISGASGNYLSVSPLSPLSTSTTSTTTENTSVDTSVLVSGSKFTFDLPTIPPTMVWSPTDDLYTDAAGTIPYTGQSLTVVYTKPSTERVYTATAGNGSCTTASAPSTVTPVALPEFTIPAAAICNGTSTTLNATGTGLSYVWSPSTGLSATSGASVDANPTATTVYTVEATSISTNCKNTHTVTVTVSNPPVITSILPANNTVIPGGSAVYTVTATGTNLTYQWQVNDGSGFVNVVNSTVPSPTPYTNATTAALTVSGIIADMNGYQYRCIVSGENGCVDATSSNVSLTVDTVGITSQPVSTTVCAGNDASFTVAASSEDPEATISYLWGYTVGSAEQVEVPHGFDPLTGLTFDGETTDHLTMTGTTTSNSGIKFQCFVNAITSAEVTLTVKEGVTITGQPGDQTVCSTGGTATFTVAATAPLSTLTYQWQFSTNGGTSYSNYTGTGATTNSISILNPALAAEGTKYRVLVSGDAACASVTSAAATLHINNPTITAQPIAATVLKGNTATFAVTASAATSYQWQFSANGSTGWANVVNDTPTGNSYLDASSATLSVVTSATTATGSANYYRCVVTYNGCTATSTGGQLTVNYYCIPAPTSVDGTGITNVTMGDINNTTTDEAGHYGDYASQSTTAAQLSTVNFAITYATGFTYDTKIWIDFNDDADFTDAGENVYTGVSLATNPTTLTGSFTIPLTAPIGSHRMRVGGVDAGPPTPCWTSSFGSFEDYTINITAAPTCSGTPVAGTVSAPTTGLCSGGVGTTLTLTGASSGVLGLSNQWYYSTNGTTFAAVSGATGATLDTGSLSADAYYYCTTSCSYSGLSADSNTVHITINNPLITASTPGGRCGTGTVILGATANAGSTVSWYATSTNGTSLGTGTSFTTPSISTTTTYYAEANTASGLRTQSGLGNTSTPTSTGASAERGIVFTAAANGTIVSAQYYSPTLNVTNTVTVRLVDNATGTQIGSSLSLPIAQGATAGFYTMNLNLAVTAGTTYRLLASFSQSVNRISTGASYSTAAFNNLGALGTITSGYDSGVSTTSYNYFHNIVAMVPGCASARTAVVATVTPQPTATISYAGSPYCSDVATGAVSLSGTNAYTGGTFSSTSGLTIDSSTGAVTPSASTPGTYTVTYTTNASTYCTPQTATATVVIYSPVLTSGFSYASASYCTNSTSASPTVTGTSGTFTASPSGLSINATTGAINFATSTPGTYTVTNTVTACSNSSTTDFGITVYPIAVITAQPASTTVCLGSNASITVAGSGTGTVAYQWQVSTNGTTWSNVSNDSTYSGSTSGTLSITSPAGSMSGYQYRAVVSDSNPCSGVTSGVATLTISQVAAPIISPSATNVCTGGIQALTVTNPLSGNATLGTATTLTGATSQPTAFCNRWAQYWNQTIYTAAELSAAGLSAGSSITSITYTTTTQGDASNNTNFSIRIATTANSTLSAFQTTGFTTVYGPATYTHAVGANVISFSTPYVWDGTSNIVLDVRQDGIDSTNNAITTFTAAADNKNISAITSTASSTTTLQAMVASASVTPTASTTRLNVIFTFSAGTTTWTPITGLYTNAGATTAYTTGASVGTVYTKPTTSTSYTATNTNSLGCTNSATVAVTVLTPSTLGSITQPSTTCSGLQTVFALTGLVPSSTSTIAYTINGVAQTAITGVVANASGTGSFSVALAAFNNGRTLAITSITRTDLSPSCATTITANNTVVLSIGSTTSHTTTVTACDTYTWSGPLGNGTTYSASGTYNNVTTNASGCNHTETLVLTINNSTSSVQTVTTSPCGTPYTWSVNGVTYSTSGTYTVTGTNAAGCTDTKTLVLTIPSCESVVTVKMNIEGYYDATAHAMRPVQANQGVSASATDVDTVTIELHDATTYALVASTTAMLQTNGNAVAHFSTAPAGSFLIAVKHRNAVQTWSATPQTVGATPLTYDFTTAANKAMGDNMVMLESGVYGFYSGDLNQDDNVDGLDYGIWELDYNDLAFGYYATDLNGDGNVDGLDYYIWETNYNNLIYSVHP